jgi:hypothetical protein
LLEQEQGMKEPRKQPVDDSKSVAGLFIFLGILIILGGIFAIKTQVTGRLTGKSGYEVVTGVEAQVYGVLLIMFGTLIVSIGIFLVYLAKHKEKSDRLDKMLHDKKIQLSNFVKNSQKK